MMNNEERIRRLEKKAKSKRLELKCPACGWRTVVFGDVWTDLLVLDWEAGSYDAEKDELTYNKEANLSSYDPALVELFFHEHDYGEFIEMRSGKSLFDPTLSGMNLGGSPPVE